MNYNKNIKKISQVFCYLTRKKRTKMELTDWQKFIIEQKNEWFSQSEIIDSLLFEMPKGQLKINEESIYFNLKLITGVDYFHLPGDVQSSYWFICNKWKEEKRQELVRKYIYEKWNFDFNFEFEQQKIPLEGIIFAITFSQNFTFVVEKHTRSDMNYMIFLHQTNKKKYGKITNFYEKMKKDYFLEIVEVVEKKNEKVIYVPEDLFLNNSSFLQTEKEQEPIDFKKFDLDPIIFYNNILYFFEMNKF